jgi:hypothetical protein
MTLLCKKLCHPLFDTRDEVVSKNPTWIKLPNLPLKSWYDYGLKAIREVLGNFIVVDASYKSNNFISVAQILVDLDPHQGIFESMEMVVGDQKYIHIFYYVNIPFMCVHCHKVNHILSGCVHPFQRHFLGKTFGEFIDRVSSPGLVPKEKVM